MDPDVLFTCRTSPITPPALTDPEVERGLRRRLTQADDEARIMLARLAAARAWHRCLGLLTGGSTTQR
mgnify:CR=1 FL=1